MRSLVGWSLKCNILELFPHNTSLIYIFRGNFCHILRDANYYFRRCKWKMLLFVVQWTWPHWVAIIIISYSHIDEVEKLFDIKGELRLEKNGQLLSLMICKWHDACGLVIQKKKKGFWLHSFFTLLFLLAVFIFHFYFFLPFPLICRERGPSTGNRISVSEESPLFTY